MHKPNAIASRKYLSIRNRDIGVEKTWPRDKFIAWYEKQEQRCFYCKITSEESGRFYEIIETYRTKWRRGKNTRGKTLEIDKKENTHGYCESNCCLACYYCNNAKSDVFAPQEFQIIADAIGKAIRQRIHKTRTRPEGTRQPDSNVIARDPPRTL